MGIGKHETGEERVNPSSQNQQIQLIVQNAGYIREFAIPARLNMHINPSASVNVSVTNLTNSAAVEFTQYFGDVSPTERTLLFFSLNGAALRVETGDEIEIRLTFFADGIQPYLTLNPAFNRLYPSDNSTTWQGQPAWHLIQLFYLPLEIPYNGNGENNTSRERNSIIIITGFLVLALIAYIAIKK